MNLVFESHLFHFYSCWYRYKGPSHELPLTSCSENGMNSSRRGENLNKIRSRSVFKKHLLHSPPIIGTAPGEFTVPAGGFGTGFILQSVCRVRLASVQNHSCFHCHRVKQTNLCFSDVKCEMKPLYDGYCVECA